MSYVIACPICGSGIAGPTQPPSLSSLQTVEKTCCRRCDTRLQITIDVVALGPHARDIEPLKTSK